MKKDILIVCSNNKQFVNMYLPIKDNLVKRSLYKIETPQISYYKVLYHKTNHDWLFAVKGIRFSSCKVIDPNIKLTQEEKVWLDSRCSSLLIWEDEE